jgi:hypothetical protein
MIAYWGKLFSSRGNKDIFTDDESNLILLINYARFLFRKYIFHDLFHFGFSFLSQFLPDGFGFRCFMHLKLNDPSANLCVSQSFSE